MTRGGSGQPRFEIRNHLEQAVFQATLADAADDALHFLGPPGLTELRVDRRITEQDDAPLQLGHEDQERRATFGAVQTPFCE